MLGIELLGSSIVIKVVEVLLVVGIFGVDILIGHDCVSACRSTLSSNPPVTCGYWGLESGKEFPFGFDLPVEMLC